MHDTQQGPSRDGLRYDPRQIMLQIPQLDQN